MAKKRREADAVQVELMDRDKKISELTNQNRISEAESARRACLLTLLDWERRDCAR